MVLWEFVAAALLVTVSGFELTDKQYHQMPKLFHLDDWEECYARRGAYCLGTFDLMPHRNDKLLSMIQRYSANKYHFNHTHIHRGLCLPTTCAHIQPKDLSLRARFGACVNNLTRMHYGLETNLTEFKYCRTQGRKRPVDRWDLSFAFIVGVVLVMNAVGTAYDVMWNTDGKRNKQLTAWSLVANWRRLTADYSNGDPRLNSLKPVQGIKSISLLIVMLAHSILAYHITYTYNPLFLEKSSETLQLTYFQNGTSLVQTFIMISSFLLSYNLLIAAADNPKKQLSLKMLPQRILHRFTRISPLYLFVLGLATSWWRHAGDGPLWAPLVEGDASRCRNKWWAHALYVNNFVQADNKCLMHTWFLAVDMQLHIVVAILTLLLARWPRTAVRILGVMIVASIVMNFAIIYHLNLKPVVYLMMPETLRTEFQGARSWTWLYTAPWESLPAALIGLLVAFVYHSHQMENYKRAENTCIRFMYRLSIPAILAWTAGGYWVKDISDPFWLSLYAAVDRPIFTTLMAFGMYGFFNKIDTIWWKLFSWRGWEVPSRMSLPIYLVHWLVTFLLLALRTNTSSASWFDIIGHWLNTVFLTCLAALPLHLLVELPATRFLQSLNF